MLHPTSGLQFAKVEAEMTTRQPDNDRKNGNVTIILDIGVFCTTA